MMSGNRPVKAKAANRLPMLPRAQNLKKRQESERRQENEQRHHKEEIARLREERRLAKEQARQEAREVKEEAKRLKLEAQRNEERKKLLEEMRLQREQHFLNKRHLDQEAQRLAEERKRVERDISEEKRLMAQQNKNVSSNQNAQQLPLAQAVQRNSIQLVQQPGVVTYPPYQQPVYAHQSSSLPRTQTRWDSPYPLPHSSSKSSWPAPVSSQQPLQWPTSAGTLYVDPNTFAAAAWSSWVHSPWQHHVVPNFQHPPPTSSNYQKNQILENNRAPKQSNYSRHSPRRGRH